MTRPLLVVLVTVFRFLQQGALFPFISWHLFFVLGVIILSSETAELISAHPVFVMRITASFFVLGASWICASLLVLSYATVYSKLKLPAVRQVEEKGIVMNGQG